MGMSHSLLRPRQTGFTPKNITGLYAWYDASKTSGVVLNGTTVSQFTDLSGSGLHLSQVNAALQPAYTTAGRNGLNCITFSGGGNGGVSLRAASISDWNFLHDGSYQYAAYIVASNNGTSGSGVVGTYISTRAVTGATYNTRGMSMFHDFGGLVGNNLIRTAISASGGLVVRRDLSATGAGATRAYELLGDPANATSASRLTVKTQAGTSGSLTNGTTTAEAGDAAGALCLGNSATSTNFQLVGTVCEVIFYRRASAVTSTESSTILSYLTKKWGL